jgi:hypothetical protein
VNSGWGGAHAYAVRITGSQYLSYAGHGGGLIDGLGSAQPVPSACRIATFSLIVFREGPQCPLVHGLPGVAAIRSSQNILTAQFRGEHRGQDSAMYDPSDFALGLDSS